MIRSATNMFWEPVDFLGKKTVAVFAYSFQIFRMVYLSFRAVILDQSQGLRTVFSVVSAQIYFTGWQALPLITLLAMATGAIVVMQSTMQLSKLGGANMLGELLIAVIVREVGPLLTAIIVIARSGTAVASELGNMRVNSETEALESMGINPLSYVVFPRLAGGVVSVLCLGLYFVFIAFVGGFFAAHFGQDLSLAFYLDTLSQSIGQEDVFLFLIKNFFSGTIIFVICCYQGLLVKGSPHEVPQVTTKAVVNSIIYVMAFNLTVTFLSYLGSLTRLGFL